MQIEENKLEMQNTVSVGEVLTIVVHFSKTSTDIVGCVIRLYNIITQHIKRRSSKIEPENGWGNSTRGYQQVNMSTV